MVQKFEYRFSPAGENRRIHLYLPDAYDSCQERYPVLYMFDGHNLFFDSDATYGKSWGLKDFLDRWQKKLIVVGMECGHAEGQRITEYSPYPIHTQAFGDVDGQGIATMDWLVHDLKPYIDSTYRTWSHREATAIGGSSMGGLMALFAVLRYNQWFSKAAAVSPAVFFALDSLRREVQQPLNTDTRIFFSWGTDELSPEHSNQVDGVVRELEAGLQRHGARTCRYCQPGGRHNEASWEQQVPMWMEFLWY